MANNIQHDFSSHDNHPSYVTHTADSLLGGSIGSGRALASSGGTSSSWKRTDEAL